MIAKLQAKWRATINDVQRQLSMLLQQRKWAKRISNMVRQNRNFVYCQSPFVQDSSLWYVAYVVMAIRRQADPDKRTISLRGMLEQMIANPEALNGVTWSRGGLDTAEITADIERLGAVSERIIRVADKEIAHADRVGAFADESDRPTFAELDECIDAYADVAKKYVASLAGAGMSSLEPTEQFDGDDIFRFPWIPECSKCHHAADYHPDTAGICNGAAGDYHRALSEGRIGLVEPCDCPFTETEVYTQTSRAGDSE